MSRLARKQIAIPQGVTVSQMDDTLTVKGPKGEERLPLLPFVRVAIAADGIKVEKEGNHTQSRANMGTMWSLTRNAIEGITSGFSKVLEIEGVGYRAAVEGSTLVVSLGYVHPVRFPIPPGIQIAVEKNVVTVSGTSKDLVGRVASQIRALKKPEPYKGKGIRYRGEVVRRKVGKKAATAAA